MKRIMVSSAVVAAGLAVAAPANADQYEYVDMLDSHGVYYESISDVIDLGKFICMRLRNGISPQIAALSASAQYGYSRTDSAIILASAVTSMCSDQLPALNAYVNGPAPQPAGPITPHPCATANPPAGCGDGSY